jgi:two-component system sensor histidine kinase PilS (NtrC family)
MAERPGGGSGADDRRAQDRRADDRRADDRRRGERRRGGERRRSERRQADAAASWFAAVGVGAEAAADSRFADGWGGAEPADSRFLSQQARRIVGGGPTAFQRILRAFLAARAALGLALVLALAASQWFGTKPGWTVLALGLGYGVQAVAVWWWLRPADDGAPRLSRGQWLLTIGFDLLVFSALYLLESSPGISQAALLVLPVLMAGVLTPRLAALGVAAALTLMLLGHGAWRALAGAEPTSALTPAALTAIGLFLVTLLAGELAGRLAREERTARGSLELARQQAQLARLVIDEMGEGVLVIDRRARVRSANPAARRLLVADGMAPPAPFALRAVSAWAPLVQAVEQALREPARPEGGRDLALDFGAAGRRTLRLRVRFTRRRPADGDDADAQPPAQEELCVLFVEDLRAVLARTRQEKLAAMGRMSAGIAHEIRNPLAAIAQANALLREDPAAPQAQRLAAMVADNVERLRRIVDEVLEVAAAPAVQPATIDAHSAVAAVAADWAATAGVAPGAGGRLRLEIGSAALPVAFDPEHLRRVLVNLLDNAQRHASDAAGAIVVELRRVSPAQACIAVASDGAPIAPEVEPHLFEPFYSTRSRGSGLGLYICRELCERNGASIDYRQRPAGQRHRNEFVITLAAAAAARRA